MFSTEEVSSLFTKATEFIDDDTETAIEAFKSAVKTNQRIVTSGNVSGKPWVDFECTEKCRVVRKENTMQ